MVVVEVAVAAVVAAANVMITEQRKLEKRAEGRKRPEVRMSGGGGRWQ